MNLASISSVFIVLLAVAIQVIFLFVSETPDLIFEHLPSHLQSWFQRGLTHDIDGFKVFCIDEGPKDGSSIETIIFIHGFPTSSFDYHKSIQFFKDKYRVVMCDHVGFGFSSKPREVNIEFRPFHGFLNINWYDFPLVVELYSKYG